ncbi:oxidoreductase domain-containing protein [Thraustotheca clavata]|uniref:Oxidoreductase domain-containing protein n=1 Tax=Thraustotheca clavata TaxID=74557 RepID=A0A1V9YD75_9STRA|nr:oxidoreductase domain-containing protein [Thraustotheca clavata]
MGPVRALVVGAGQRGRQYAEYALERPDLLTIVGVAEPLDYRRHYMAKAHTISSERVFTTWTEAAQVEKFADCVIIATQDSMHADLAVAFADLGYHILLEKPMAVTKEDCVRIHAAAKRNKIMLAVCHVMRCTPYSLKLRELATSIGNVVNIQHIEPVGFWHQVHSYVRGNWRNQQESTFMLMAKSCHDIDYLQFLMQKDVRAVSSFGSLFHFREENKPQGAGDRCTSCPIEESCVYSAKKMYLGVEPGNMDTIDIENCDGSKASITPSKQSWYCGKASASQGHQGWPLNVLHEDPTVENITKELENGRFGRCVYKCDNDVVDNQVVNFQFVDGSTASFTMVAFTEQQCVRTTRIFGTHGELTGNGSTIRHFDFLTRKVTEITPSSGPVTRLTGHGGADYFLIENFVRGVRENDESVLLTGADESLKSHLMVFAAEEARLKDTVVHMN